MRVLMKRTRQDSRSESISSGDDPQLVSIRIPKYAEETVDRLKTVEEGSIVSGVD
jgi:hypothetical protein